MHAQVTTSTVHLLSALIQRVWKEINTLLSSPLTSIYCIIQTKEKKKRHEEVLSRLYLLEKTHQERHNRNVHALTDTQMPPLSLSLVGSGQWQEHAPSCIQPHIHFQSWRVFTQSCESICLWNLAAGFCSLLSSFVCISVCCAQSLVSPLHTHWSLLASYPLNISVFLWEDRGDAY